MEDDSPQALSSTGPVVRTRSLVRLPQRMSPLALPPATRQMEEGYWLGAMIGPAHVEVLARMGIRVVLSAVVPDDQTLVALREAQIQQVSVPMGDTFLYGSRILEVTDRYAPQEVFIHCRHGADRTGAIAAFLLVTRHGWALADALYSVLYPSLEDTEGLAGILLAYGIDDHRPPSDPSVGLYSVSPSGVVGGLKTRSERYARLVITAIDAILEVGTAPTRVDLVDASVAPR